MTQNGYPFPGADGPIPRRSNDLVLSTGCRNDGNRGVRGGFSKNSIRKLSR